MKKSVNLSDIIKSKPLVKEENVKRISYSQLSIYHGCKYHWYLRYVKKLKPFTSSIHSVFGTAMHETLQEYLRVMYTSSAKAADQLPLSDMLAENLYNVYYKEVDANNGEHFSSMEELREFYDDGVEILTWFRKKRGEFFSIKGYQLLGIETELSFPVEANEKVFLTGFIDLILYDKDDDRIIIYDFKTSTRGWKDKEKKDQNKINRLLLYKRYFSKQFEIEEDKIEVVFFILKRKIYENSEFPQPRVQVFRPACGTSKVKQAANTVENFVKEVFTPEGEYNQTLEYPKSPSDHNCRFCPFNSSPEICDKKS